LALLLALVAGWFARPANVPNVGGLFGQTCPREKLSSVLFVSRNFESALLLTPNAYVSSGILKLRSVPQAERNYENKK